MVGGGLKPATLGCWSETSNTVLVVIVFLTFMVMFELVVLQVCRMDSELCSNHFSSLLCWPWCLNEDPSVWLGEARKNTISLNMWVCQICSLQLVFPCFGVVNFINFIWLIVLGSIAHHSCDFSLNKSSKTNLCCHLVKETGSWFILIFQPIPRADTAN